MFSFTLTAVAIPADSTGGSLALSTVTLIKVLTDWLALSSRVMVSV